MPPKKKSKKVKSVERQKVDNSQKLDNSVNDGDLMVVKNKHSKGSQNVNKSAQSTFIIGDGYNGNFNGRMGPHRMYNKILTAAEVSQNFNAQRARFGI